VLLLADAGCTTGFGVVSQQIGDRLVTQYGHDIHALAVNYRGDYWKTAMKLYVPTLKNSQDIYGKGRMVEMMSMVLPDVTLMINDPYVILRLIFRNDFDEEYAVGRFAPFIAYLPVDGTSFPTGWAMLPDLVKSLPAWQITETQLRPAPSLTPVVMSKHGHTLFPDAPLVYHGIDTETFRPVSEKAPIVSSLGASITSKREAKRLFGLPPDCKLILRVDRNSHRKNYVDTYRAVAPLMRDDPDLHVWFHCRTEGDDIELNQVVQRDMSIADRFHWPDRYSTFSGWGLNDLVILYNAADVFVSTSYGEGFGLTLGEAAACGLPIVAQNVSSIPEVVGPGGILLEPERLIGVASGQDKWLPNVEAFTSAIYKLLDSRGARRSLGEAGRDHVISSFSWDEAALRFHELITGVVQKTSGSTPSGGLDADTQ
jgi:glycosyltransferase involved in cell wall biosynthesis